MFGMLRECTEVDLEPGSACWPYFGGSSHGDVRRGQQGKAAAVKSVDAKYGFRQGQQGQWVHRS
eukprot:1144125-Pelagomonas_calceolata.AAC.3